MRIGDAARLSGLTVKTVRYYADIGLVEPERRHDSQYRDYDDADIRRLGFVRRAREFGFSIETCRDLLELYADRDRNAAEVKAITLEHLTIVKAKLQELQLLHDELQQLADRCLGGDRPDCPILAAFAGEK